jgi:hypothetical protein
MKVLTDKNNGPSGAALPAYNTVDRCDLGTTALSLRRLEIDISCNDLADATCAQLRTAGRYFDAHDHTVQFEVRRLLVTDLARRTDLSDAWLMPRALISRIGDR